MTQNPKDAFLKDTSPLGKSVEEIEEATENRINPSIPAEERTEGEGIVPAVPVAATAGLGVGGGAAVGAALITEDLGHDEVERQD